MLLWDVIDRMADPPDELCKKPHNWFSLRLVSELRLMRGDADQDVEDSAHVFGGELLVLHYRRYLLDKNLVELLAHGIIVDVADLGEDLEEA